MAWDGWLNWSKAMLGTTVLLAISHSATPTIAADRGHATTSPVNSKAAACIKLVVGPGSGTQRCISPGSGLVTWFADCADCPQMVIVPKGRAAVGSPDDEHGHSPHEKRRTVNVANPFAIGRFAVTFAEWDACVGDGGCNGYRPGDEGWGRGNRPVINVNWQDAVAYVHWLSRKSGKRYRLPMEHERELAARAGSRGAYWWGATIDLSQANFDIPVSAKRGGGTVDAGSARARQQTVPVDTFAANPWGLFNVHGNVWEWTADCWSAGTMPETKPKQPPFACGERLAKGGSWNDVATETRSASRIGFGATTRNAMQGFRVVRVLP